MTISAAANKGSGVGWLGLAASPVFAVMGWIAVSDPHSMAMCSVGAGVWTMDGMTPMYLLMSVFHLSPWLKLAAGRSWLHS
jgi:hypothetical protein